MKLQPLQDNILLEQITQEEKTKSGIVLPDNIEKEKPQEGKVVAVGPGKILESGKRLEMSVKKGDKVIFKKYGPDEIKIDGKEYLIAKEDDILAIIE